MNETISSISNEVINPSATLIIEDIESRLPSEDTGVISESGRINREGRDIAENVYTEFLERSEGNFSQVLDMCKDAESLLDKDNPDSRDLETIRIIQSIRGKVVYQAHKTWVEEKMLVDKMGDESASNIMRYAKILKADKNVNVYEEAASIEKKREEINNSLRQKNEELAAKNSEILEEDIEEITKSQTLSQEEKKSIVNEIKNKLGSFAKNIIEPKTRRKIVSGALATLAVAGLAYSYMTNMGKFGVKPVENISSYAQLQPKRAGSLPHYKENHHKVEEKTPPADNIFANDFFDSTKELPDVINNYLEPKPQETEQVNKPRGTEQAFKPTPELKLTNTWDEEARRLKLEEGKGKIELSLFLEKNTDFNYWKGAAPDGRSALIWNATEAAYRFGEVEMRPGDTMSFTEHIGFGDMVLKGDLEKGNTAHGDGYIVNGEGACFASTVFGEALGIFVTNSDGDKIPLFKTDVGAVQSHGKDTYGYYNYLYHGPGVGINSSEYGKLVFSVNPDLPKDVVVNINMSTMDTNPDNPEDGIFSPTVTVSVGGLPDNWNYLEHQRLTANRSSILEKVTGRAW